MLSHLESILLQQQLSGSKQMRKSKIILYILVSSLIVFQLLSIFKTIGNSDPYSFGFIIGKLIIIGFTLIIAKIISRFIDQLIT